MPEGWVFVRLSEIGKWAIGNGFPTSQQGHEDKPILFCKVSDMNLQGNEKWIQTTQNTIDEDIANKIRARVHPIGTVIFPKIGGAIATNKRRIIIKPTAIDNNCLGIIPYRFCNSEWLYLLLNSMNFTKYQSGTSVPALNQGTLELIITGLPPIAEQHRIVAKVDQLMSLCDELEARQQKKRESRAHLNSAALDRLLAARAPGEFAEGWRRICDNFELLYNAPENVGELRQAILQLTIMGKLVAQDERDEPADELLTKIKEKKERLVREKKIKKIEPMPPIHSEEEPYNLPKGWRWTYLAEVFDVRDGTHDSPKYLSEGIPLVTSKNLYNGYLDLSDVKYISKEDHLNISERSNVEKHDILFAMIGSIGNPVIVDIDTKFSIKNVALFKYYSLDLSVPKFLRYFLITSSEKMREQAAGGVQSFVSLGYLRKYLIPLPPLAEQNRIVTKVDQLMSLCDKLEAGLKRSQADSEKLMETVVGRMLAG